MKKLLAIAAVMTALFTVGPMAPTTAEAGYRSKVVGKCQHCRGNIYAYYKPVQRYQNRLIYGWVTAAHTQCQSRYLQSRSNYGHSRYSYTRQGHRYIHPFSSHSYVRPGITLRFGSSRGYCR